ncbi:MAG: flagellar basal body-associated FliL family protein [Acidobacteriota bacterium]
MRQCVKLVLFLLMLTLALPPSVPASSEGGHGGGESKKKEKGDKKEAGKVENGVITIGPLVVNVMSNKGYRFFRLEMIVECADNETAERLVKADAKEELVLLLSNKMADDLLSNSGKMVLRKELIDLFSKYAGQGKVKNLYFSEFVFQ